MKRGHKLELGLVLAATCGAALFRGRFPQQIQSGYFILALGLLFLFQTLVRDIVLLTALRRIPRAILPSAQCICLESAIGFIPVIAAGSLLWSGLSRPIILPCTLWPITIAAVLLLGFWLKDYVVEWNPWRIRRDPDHVNMLFSWERKRHNP